MPLLESEQLRVTEGKERGKLLSVEADLLIGRLAAEDEGRLGGDPKISRRHARVSRGADRKLTIEDLGSVNGTFVNDERIDAPRRLDVGDVITVGKTVLQVTAGAEAVPEAPRPSPLDLRPDLPREFDDVVRRAMAKDPTERYPSAGDLGQAALVAAGGLRRASPWSVVATGEAAFLRDEQVAQAPVDAPRAFVPERARVGRTDLLRWAIALAGLAIVAVGMVAALHGISTL